MKVRDRARNLVPGLLRGRGAKNWLCFAKCLPALVALSAHRSGEEGTRALPEDSTAKGHRLGNLMGAANIAQVLEEFTSTIQIASIRAAVGRISIDQLTELYLQ